MQVWACFLETDLQHPKKAPHLGWFTPSVGVECGRSQSQNPQGEIESFFLFPQQGGVGKAQAQHLGPPQSGEANECVRPQKLYELRECPPGEASGSPTFLLATTPQPHPWLGLALAVTLKARTVGVCVEGFRKEGGRRDTRVGEERSSVLVNPPPDFGETAPRCRWFARPSRWRLPNRKRPSRCLILTGLVWLPRRGTGSHPPPCPSPPHATPKPIYSWPAPAQPDFLGTRRWLPKLGVSVGGHCGG